MNVGSVMVKYCLGCYKVLSKKEYNKYKHKGGGFFDTSFAMDMYRAACCSEYMRRLIDD
jgi:hypothetical protein